VYRFSRYKTIVIIIIILTSYARLTFAAVSEMESIEVEKTLIVT